MCFYYKYLLFYAMYWAKSSYIVNSFTHLTFLMNLFSKTRGELEIVSCGKLVKKYDWGVNPIKNVVDSFDEYKNILPFEINCRLCGPDTILAVAPKLLKLDRSTFNFEHDRKNALTEWTNFIDTQLDFEMHRTNDIGIIHKRPDNNLASMNELLLACQLSQHCSHILIGTYNCVVVCNENCTYLPTVSLHEEYIQSCIFDMDDGFVSIFGDKCEQLNYMNGSFVRWKHNDYIGKLSDYCHEYKDHIEK